MTRTAQKAIIIVILLVMAFGGCATSERTVARSAVERDNHDMVRHQRAQAYVAYHKALSYLRGGDAEAAKDALRQTIELDPDASRACILLGSIHLRQKHLFQAEAYLLKALETDPESMPALQMLLQTYELMRDRAGITDVYQRFVQAQPDSYLFRFGLGLAYLRNNQLPEAVTELAQVAILNSKFAGGYYALGLAHEQSGNFDTALENYRKVFEVDPDNHQQYGEEAYDRIINLLVDRQQYNDAISESAARAPVLGRPQPTRRPSPRGRPAPPLPEQDDTGDLQASDALQASTSETPRILEDQGLILFLAGDLPRAQEKFQAVLQKNPIFVISRCLLWVCERESGLAVPDRLAEVLDSDRQKELMALANLLGDEELPPNLSTKAVAQAIARGDEEPLFYTFLGIYYSERLSNNSSNAKKSVESFKAALQLDPDNELANFHLGATYERLKKYDQAARYLERSIELNPKNAQAYNYLGYMWAEKGVRLNDALELVKRALEIEPDNGAYLDSLGWVYFKQGDLESAVQCLEKAAEQLQRSDRDDPVVRDHLGDVYHKKGQTNKAIEEWQKALTLRPEDESLLKGLKDKLRNSETRF